MGDVTVIVAIDGSEQADQAFQFYLDNIHRPGNKLVLVHAAEPPAFGASAAMPMGMDFSKHYNHMVNDEKEKVKKLEAKFAEKMKAASAAGKIKAVFSHKPGEVIIDTADDVGATYIVMGTRGQSTVKRTLMGSVSDYVVHHAKCPVMICRD